jgi:hypothetical protein
LSRFVAAGKQQRALDYFGFEGKYDPNNPRFKENGGEAYTDPQTGDIYFNEGAFNNGYSKFKFYADHERIHREHYMSGKSPSPKDLLANRAEEWKVYNQNYKRQGLYSGNRSDIVKKMNYYGIQADVYNMETGPFVPGKMDFIYSIPRLW